MDVIPANGAEPDDLADGLLVEIASREAALGFLRRRRREREGPPSVDELRADLVHHDEAEAVRRTTADANRAKLVAAIAEAEHAERIEAARAALLAEAMLHDTEADRLVLLAAERADALAAVDDEIGKLTEQRTTLERVMQADADAAVRVLVDDPEEAGRLAGLNVGRRQALDGLATRIGEAQRNKQETEARYRPPDGAQQPDGRLLFSPLTTGTLADRVRAHRTEAGRLRRRAADDPLGEPVAEQPATAPHRPRGGVLLSGSRLGEPPEPATGRAFGFPPNSLGERSERLPPRGRR